MKLIHQEQTEHHDISVWDTAELYGERGRFRILQFSEDAVQGAVDLDRPERILFEYPRAMIHLMEYNQPEFEKIFMIGHGIGTIANYLPDRSVVTAELDAGVVEISRQWFGSRTDHVIIGDGRLILEQEEDESLDYLLLDAFSADGTPGHLVSDAFFTMVYSKLVPGGAVLMNLAGRTRYDHTISSVYTTLQSVFPYTTAFLLPSSTGMDIRNYLLAGSMSPLRYQSRHLAGFEEIHLQPGLILTDEAPPHA
ncbi:fused MFS/spermidine synthase [Paenibacillus sp. JX-17]|uniref:Fused MFS/spermidine synthase n=1 Tax=Paenibacillus lacisoli TaxID=3064525 RepID=A0ABT9CEV7_9BACL|nr:fused MFS/spermidine synthase [Paenibacillus sp. JX-17]MDO7907806.1 fused MFS/spermidine synthase [Paenibacillus sp. JX-17]